MLSGARSSDLRSNVHTALTSSRMLRALCSQGRCVCACCDVVQGPCRLRQAGSLAWRSHEYLGLCHLSSPRPTPGRNLDLPKYVMRVMPPKQAWEGEGVVAAFRKVVGATNPLQAEPGTIRGDLARVIGRNIVHASDAPAAGAKESGDHLSDT